MRSAVALAAVLLATAAACGDADPGGTEPWTVSAPDEVGTVEDRPAFAADVETPAAASVSVPDLFQCVADADVYVQGPYPRDVADGVTVETLDVSVGDTVDVEQPSPNTGTLYLFADAATAATYADAAGAARGGSGAVTELHASTVLVTDRALRPSEGEQALLDCLPDADPAAVEPPPAGTASLGSLLACGRDAGLTARGEHSFVDGSEGRDGVVTFYSPDGFGGVTERGRTYVYPDAAAAAAHEAEVVGGEPERHALRGNTVTEFPGAVDPADPDDAAVLGCLPV